MDHCIERSATASRPLPGLRKVLVTGGAGYIGSHVVLALREAGHAVVVLDDLSSGHAEAVPAGVPLIIGDIADGAFVSQAVREHGIDAVMHFAARTVVPESVREPIRYYENNTVASHRLIEAIVKAGVGAFIFSSTAAVYGHTGLGKITEEAPTVPLSPYGRSKLMTEWMLADIAAASGLRFVILRYFNVAGGDPLGRAGQSTAAATHLIKVAAQVAVGLRDRLEIFGQDYDTPDGSCVRDYVHVSDLAAAHVDALHYLGLGGDNVTCNCGYEAGYSVHEVVRSAQAISGNVFPVIHSPRRVGDAPSVVAAADRIKQTIGWHPQHDDLPTIIRHAIAWEIELMRRAERVRTPIGTERATSRCLPHTSI